MEPSSGTVRRLSPKSAENTWAAANYILGKSNVAYTYLLDDRLPYTSCGIRGLVARD